MLFFLEEICLEYLSSKDFVADEDDNCCFQFSVFQSRMIVKLKQYIVGLVWWLLLSLHNFGLLLDILV